MKEFNLSDWVFDYTNPNLIHIDKVKEFIKRRDELDRCYRLGRITRQEHAEKCDKLAGDKLK